MVLHPCDYRVLHFLEVHSVNGLTNKQLEVLTGYTPRTIRQAVYKLRQAGYRVKADRVFRISSG